MIQRAQLQKFSTLLRLVIIQRAALQNGFKRELRLANVQRAQLEKTSPLIFFSQFCFLGLVSFVLHITAIQLASPTSISCIHML